MSGMINEDDLKEFRQEGSELLEAAEKALLSLEDGADYKTQYNAIFRAFHNLKGAAGMMEMLELQTHTHILETELVSLKDNSSLTSDQIDYFLKGVDRAKKMLWGDNSEQPPIAPPTITNNIIPIISASAVAAVTPESSTVSEPAPVITESETFQPFIEPTRFLLFSDACELTQLENDLKSYDFDVHNHSDYIDGITKFDSLLPHVVVISPKFCQTSPEELKSILKKDGHTQLFIDFDFTNLPVSFLVQYINTEFENINLKNLANEAAALLKYQYSDLLDFLRSQGKDHLEKKIMQDVRNFLKLKSLIRIKKGA